MFFITTQSQVKALEVTYCDRSVLLTVVLKKYKIIKLKSYF